MNAKSTPASIAALQERFGHTRSVNFVEGQGGLTCCRLTSGRAEAVVYLHGAHVTHFQPMDADPVLFMSKASQFEADQPIRGGVPICLPWFGQKPDDPNAPGHGFARLLPWSVESANLLPDSSAQLHLELGSSDATRQYWPHDFTAGFTVTLSHDLQMALTFKNTSDKPLTITQALHSYFAVKDVRKIRITGLENARYISKVEGGQLTTQPDEPIRFERETDRVYLDTDATTVIEDPGMHRRIVISKDGSQSTVVWNPWVDKSARMPDFGDDEWPHMVCVETANALQNALTIEPGQSHTIRAAISIEKLD